MGRASLGITPISQRGFSLLEILVACTLLALAMGTLMQLFSRGINGASLADQYARATLLAESQLSLIGVEQPIKEGTTSGQYDDTIRWQLTITPYQDPTPREAATIDLETNLTVKLYQIDLQVSIGEGERTRNLTFSTLQLGPKT